MFLYFHERKWSIRSIYYLSSPFLRRRDGAVGAALGAGSAAEIGNTKATANERAARRNAMKEKIGWAARFETRRKNQRVFFMGRCLNLWGD